MVVLTRILFFGLGFLIFTGTREVLASQQAPLINWELERGFRFFKYPSDFEFQRLAYRDFKAKNRQKEPTIHELDAQLNDIGWWRDDLIAPDVARWYGKTQPVHAIDLLRAWRKKEITEKHRYRGYLELADELQRSRHYSWEYYPGRLGWASLLFPAHHDNDVENENIIEATNVAVCWNRADQKHNNCGDDYIEPKTHNVVLRAVEASGRRILDGTCVWTIDKDSGAKFAGQGDQSIKSFTGNCASELVVEVPYGEKSAINLTRDNISAPQSDIVFDDILVVGTGDSFSSGEGNPDVPVKLAWGYSLQDPIVGPEPYKDNNTGAPVRKNSGQYFAAQWIDRACHRSAYSYQMRAALQLALVEPHRAITFLGYACSGAEVNEGLFLPWNGPESPDNKKNLESWQKAQFPLLLSELCRNYDGSKVQASLSIDDENKLIDDGQYRILPSGGALADEAYRCKGAKLGSGFKRQIDLFYLSIGGNDLGFADWIAAALTAEPAWEGLGAFLPVSGIIEPYKKRLKQRYNLLREFIDQRLSFADRGRTPVIMYTYPISYEDANGKSCAKGNASMTIFAGGIPEVPFIQHASTICLQHPLSSIARTAQDLNATIVDLTKPKPAVGTINHPGWIAAEGYAGKFSARGYCASKISGEPEPYCVTLKEAHEYSLKLKFCGKVNALETLHLPMNYSSSADVCAEWRPYDPIVDLLPYAHRTRLYRTMNDVYLIINQMSSNTQDVRWLGALDLKVAARSGAFHPTAEAHAIIADDFFKNSSKLLGPPVSK